MNNPTLPTNSLSSLTKMIDEFAHDRDWEKFHSPKNLTMALTVEASELMEIFQWQDGQEGIDSLSEKKRHAVEQEVADVLIYLLRFCSVTGIDPLVVAEEKLKHNAKNYPSDLVKGRSDKYTEY